MFLCRELKAYEASKAVVLRDGLESQISATDVVIGDILMMKVGDKVPADCRIIAIHSSVLTVDQSILTGESDSVMKSTTKLNADKFTARSFSFRSNITSYTANTTGSADSPSNHASKAEPVKVNFGEGSGEDLIVNQDKTNMVFSGTLVTAGKAVAVVTATGTGTAIGKIHANMLQVEAEQEEEKTPLKLQLDKFGEQLSKLIGVVCLAV